MERNEENLYKALTNLVTLLPGLGIYRLNKLLYLFEYFHIKNFGERFIKDKFVKLPHGPVLNNYKKTLKQARKLSLIEVSDASLKQNNKWEKGNEICKIFPGGNTSIGMKDHYLQNQLMLQVVDKYGGLNAVELEKTVYDTSPLKKMKELGTLNITGSYVLTSPNIKIKNYWSSDVLVKKEMAKYSNVFSEEDKIKREKIRESLTWLDDYKAVPKYD